MINQNSVLITPRVIIDRDQVYNRVEEVELSTINSFAPATMNFPFDTLIVAMSVRVYAQDEDGNTIAISDDDPMRDQFKVYIKSVGSRDLMSGAMDISSFNRIYEGNSEFQGFIAPTKTDISLEFSHKSNGTSQNSAPFRFAFVMAGYEVIQELPFTPKA